MKNKIIIIVGPTAVGKTKLGVDLAKAFDGEVISGDSMQVYKNLDIGTAKVTKEEAQDVPHHLIDILEVDDSYSASVFKEQASALIIDITNRGKIPIIVGGTGLYIESLIYDVSHGGETEKDEVFRKRLEEFAATNGNRALWEKLKEKDPKAAEGIHENNVRRVIRALEVIDQTGELYSAQQNERKVENMLYNAFIIGLNTERSLLYERINLRVDMMMAEGLLQEVKWLDNNAPRDAQAARGIGYKEFTDYLDGEKSLDSCIALLKKNSRNYAKRQLTWFNNRTPVTVWADLVQHPQEQFDLSDNIATFLRDGEE